MFDAFTPTKSKQTVREFSVTDLFCGAGGSSTGAKMALEEKGLSVNLLAINHWNIAIATHKENHPEANHLCQSINALNPYELIPSRRLHLLIASPECFPAGTLILSERGLVPIEEIIIGDIVLTHKGRWRRVTQTMSRIADTIIVKGHGHPGLETTVEHPFYARTQSQVWVNSHRRYSRVLSKESWIPAGELTSAKTRWATPIHGMAREIPFVPGRGMSIENHNFWWLVGRWLGDGTVRIRPDQGGEITIVAGDHEADALEQKLRADWQPEGSGRSGANELRWRRRKVRTACLFECGHQGLAEWLVEHFGRLAHGKTIPAWAFSLHKEFRKALLEGYLSADGYKGKRVTSITTVSKRLAIGIRLIAESLGFRAGLYHSEQHV